MKGYYSPEKVKEFTEKECIESILFSQDLDLSGLIDEISEYYDRYQGISHNKLARFLKNEVAQLNCKDISEFKERIKEYPPETKKALILFYEND